MYSLYFHIPFCIHRCAYCDFNTYAGQEALIPAYVDALCREIEAVAVRAPTRLPVHTIFFGGGTPSLLTPAQFEQIFQVIRTHFDLFAPETSLEANPGTLTPDYLHALHALGFNRLSLGVQSFDAGELHQLERIHDAFDVLDAVRWARKAGFDNLNLDLIFGLPEQSLDRWAASVKQAVSLAPEHLSLYALTVEQGTPFGRWAQRGLLSIPDPDLAAEMYEWASEYLAGQGYEQYEISNWARENDECRHNLQYWRNLPYLGFGAGAHGCANRLRISNVLRIKTYIERLQPDYLIPNYPIPNIPFLLSPATVHQIAVSPYVEMQETMMLGLRLTHEGVSAAAFRAHFGQEMQSVFAQEIGELERLGLLEWAITPGPSPTGRGDGMRLRLTKSARLVGNQVFLRFVGE